ncbi:MAG: SiaB family protein kinase [Bacteroidales bacterium]|nr:SiaB family protein kinase [Bacteroidales bacterium]
MNYSKQVNILDYHSSFDQDTRISYKGPIDEKILQAIGTYIEGVLNKNQKASKKVFKIFIELAQNISYYSAEKNTMKNNKEIGVGMVIISEAEDTYNFMTGNLVKNDDIVSIIEKSEIINSLDREELREYKREQRKLPHSQKGGANIGLIQVALTSSHPLDIEVIPVDDDLSFFSIAVKIDK